MISIFIRSVRRTIPLIIFFSLALPALGSTARGDEIAKTPLFEIPAYKYWYYHKLNRIRGARVEDTYLYGDWFTRYGYSAFRTSLKDVNDRKMKEKGYIQVIGSMQNWLTRAADETAIQILREMTGLKLETVSEWQDWYSEKRGCLRLSKDSDLLVEECVEK